MSTASVVYAQLRAAIINGTFPSGEPLRQDQIARDYGVSKIPIREALIQLEADGFMEIFSGRGAFVTRLSVAEAEEIYLMRSALGANFRAQGEAEHAMLLAACKVGDVQTAVDTLVAHLTRSSGRLLDALASYPGSDKAQ